MLGSCRPACYGPVDSALPCSPQRHDERRHAAMPMLLRAGPRCPGGQPPNGQRQDPPPMAKGQGRKGQLWSVEPRVGGKTPCGRVRRAAGGGESGTRDCGGRRAETLIVEHGDGIQESGVAVPLLSVSGLVRMKKFGPTSSNWVTNLHFFCGGYKFTCTLKRYFGPLLGQGPLLKKKTSPRP